MSKYGNLKQGDTRSDGKVFFRYDVNGREYWYEKSKYKELVKKKKKTKAYTITSTKSNKMKD